MEIIDDIGQKIDNDKVMDFIFAGNALFTVKNSETGNHITYKVTKSRNPRRECYFVNSKTNGQTFLGTIFEKSKFVFSKKCTVGIDSPEVKAFAFVLDRVLKNNMPSKVEIWHNGRCCRCGRVLTDPQSIQIGIGPECLKKSNK